MCTIAASAGMSSGLCASTGAVELENVALTSHFWSTTEACAERIGGQECRGIELWVRGVEALDDRHDEARWPH